MCPDDGHQLVLLQELVDLIFPKDIRTAPRAITHPALALFPGEVVHGIWPEEITKTADLRHLHESVDLVYLTDFLYGGGDASMHTQVSPIDDTSEGEVVENVHEHVIDFLVILPQYLFLEPIVGSAEPRLVVASKKEDWVGAVYLQGQQSYHHLKGILSPIYIVPQEQILIIVWGTSQSNHLLQVVKLTMNVPHYVQRIFQVKQIRFIL